METSEYIATNYNWYIMPPTVHKLLEHSAEIAEQLELPLGNYLKRLRRLRIEKFEIQD